MFYNSYILPKIDYCLNVWAGAPKSLLDCLFHLQKRAGRTVLNVDRDTPSTYIFKFITFSIVYYIYITKYIQWHLI